jgi:predicted AAA+ superfamily ATPase
LFENKKIKFDVYVTGSNSKLLSTELSTLLTGRHKDIKVFPISFAEMIRYFTLQPDNFFYQYLCYGGLGITVNNYENQQDLQAILKDVFNDTINQDIKYRHGTKTHNQINKLIEYAYSNVGGTISIQKVPTLLKNTKQFSLSVRTIGYYLQ